MKNQNFILIPGAQTSIFHKKDTYEKKKRNPKIMILMHMGMHQVLYAHGHQDPRIK